MTPPSHDILFDLSTLTDDDINEFVRLVRADTIDSYFALFELMKRFAPGVGNLSAELLYDVPVQFLVALMEHKRIAALALMERLRGRYH